MDYDLLRVDYTLCGITYPDTLKILPEGSPRVQQKFAVGDKNGVLQFLSIKDEEPTVLFKTLPGKAITSVQLASGPGSQGDKIFAASGNEVKGYTRKGKVFLTLETTLSETITCMSVLGGDLVLGSGRVVTHYRDLRELHSYTCEDRILDLAAFPAPNSTRIRLVVLVANKGVILLEGGQLASRIFVAAGPTRLLVPPSQHSADVHALYGAADGSIGLITYNNVELSSKCLMEGRGLGAVVCGGWWISNIGAHLVVGRHDGSVQLYLIDLENLYENLRLKFTYFCGEPVTSVSGGCIGTEEGELLAATFSGRIFALRPRRYSSSLSSLTNVTQDAITARRAKLESEIIRLEKQAAVERDKYQRNTKTIHGGYSVPPLLDIQCETTGATNEGWQEIRVTSAVPLDMLFLYCNIKLDLQTDNAAVLSICPSQGNLLDLLATVRCQAGTRRLWIKVRIINEQNILRSESTKLLIYALPAGAPRVARLISVKLPALPYYSDYVEMHKLEKIDRTWCEMKVTGKFSVAEMTSWISEALPGELPRPAQAMSFARSHILLQTILICIYQRNSAIIKSDNISTLAILKDVMLNQSIQRNITIDVSCDIPKQLCYKAFQRIEDTFKDVFKSNKDSKLREAMLTLDLDITTINNDIPQLCEDYNQILNAPSKENNRHFKELCETIKQWYKDWRILSLLGGEGELSNLHLALFHCDIQETKNILLSMDHEPQTKHVVDTIDF